MRGDSQTHLTSLLKASTETWGSSTLSACGVAPHARCHPNTTVPLSDSTLHHPPVRRYRVLKRRTPLKPRSLYNSPLLFATPSVTRREVLVVLVAGEGGFVERMDVDKGEGGGEGRLYWVWQHAVQHAQTWQPRAEHVGPAGGRGCGGERCSCTSVGVRRCGCGEVRGAALMAKQGPV